MSQGSEVAAFAAPGSPTSVPRTRASAAPMGASGERFLRMGSVLLGTGNGAVRRLRLAGVADIDRGRPLMRKVTLAGQRVNVRSLMFFCVRFLRDPNDREPLNPGTPMARPAFYGERMTTIEAPWELGPPWDSSGWDGDDWDFTSAARDSPEELYGLWDDAVERSRARLTAALADRGLDQLVHVSAADGRHASLR